MYFLIDYENVKCNGMRGCEHLLPEDTVEIFFGDSTNTMANGIFQSLKMSGCEIKICKLKTIRKNALDFYIVSRVGELIGNGYAGRVLVISGDHGYLAAQEYWKECSEKKRHVFISKSIADGIISVSLADERTRRVREDIKMVSIETEFARYEESMRIHHMLEEKFKETEFQEQVHEIEEIFENASGRKVLYLDSLKRFGRKNGLVIYNRMKELVVS